MEKSPRWAEKRGDEIQNPQGPLHSWLWMSVTRDLWSWGRLGLPFLKISINPKLYGK